MSGSPGTSQPLTISDVPAQGTPSQFQIELVGSNGEPILQRPVDVEELLRQHQYSLPIGNGVTVQLEEYHHDQEAPSPDHHQEQGALFDGSSSDDYDEDEYTEDEEDAADEAVAFVPHTAPPGTREAGGWYDVLNELRREQARGGDNAEARARGMGFSAPGGQLRAGAAAATPMKLFPTARPTTAPRSRSLEASMAQAKASERDASSPQARREVWASFAPPADPHTNYKRVEYISVMDGVSGDGVATAGRHFRPSALSFHAMAAYLSAKDNGQRVLVYGGVASTSMTIQKELYEFSLLTGNWRRLEGKQFAPAGHMGHAMAVVESVDRLIVVGGVGPCGNGVGNQIRPSAYAEDPVRALRARLCFPKELLARTRALARSPSPHARCGTGSASGGTISAAGAAVALPSAPAIGFVPFLFDMNLSDQRWRAIQTAQPLPLAFHSVVAYGSQLFVFGGLTEEMVVSGQLIAVDVNTYALRLVQPADRKRRQQRQNRDGDDEATRSDGDDGDDAEIQGPGPRFMHSAVRFGNYMVVHGGFDAHNEARSDTWAFDLVNERWERLRCHSEPTSRAGHTASLVGSRMLVVGGFSGSLEESANSGEGEEVGGPTTEQVVMELNLVPSLRGEYVWRDEVQTRPPLPPLVFSASAPCGDDASVLLFGGLTKRLKVPRATGPGAKRSASAPRGTAGRSHSRGHQRGQSGARKDEDEEDEAASTPYLNQLITLDDAVVMTFPPKRHRQKHDDEDKPHVNALGVEVDPNDLPEHFKTFVRRQEDFLKKKEATALATQKKITLDEQEAMEPTIYFTDDEIEKTLEKSEELCAAFVSYKMDTLPGNVPERERRIHIVENCVSLSRQVRDVVRSMKGSQVAVTAVKSKSHRRRAGQKFEDFSAAKPFRHVVIASLIDEINGELAVMHTLNKALRTVEWEEKEGFKEAIDDMQRTVHHFTNTTNGIMGKYVSKRVEKLVKGVEHHQEKMRLLTEVVQRNREDKIWGRDEARARQREEKKAAQALADRREEQNKKSHRSHSTHTSPSQAKTTTGRTRRSTGAGYHTDENTASVNVTEKEWDSLVARAGQLERHAGALEECCREGMKSSVLDAVAAATTAPAPFAAVPPAAGVVPAPTLAAFPAPPPPQQLPQPRNDDSTSSDSGSEAPAAGAPHVTVSVPAVPQPVAPPSVPEAPAVAPVAAPTTNASPKEILIRRSNANRERMVKTAQHVSEVARSFVAALEKDGQTPSVSSVAPASETNDQSNRDVKTPSQPTSLNPPAAILSQPTIPSIVAPAAGAQSAAAASARPSGSSSGTSSSSSSASSLLPSGAPAAAQIPPPIPVPEIKPSVSAQPSVPNAPHELGSPIPIEKTQPLVESPPRAPTAPAKEARTMVCDPAPPGYRTLFLRTLRPLLALRDEVDKMGDTVALVHQNEWDGNDLSGAPQDSNAVLRYKRVKATLTSLIQSITASFLSAAGAKKPRQRVAAAPSTAAPVVGRTAATARRRSASQKAKKPITASPIDAQFPEGGAAQPPHPARGVRPVSAGTEGLYSRAHASPNPPPTLEQIAAVPVNAYRLTKLQLSPQTTCGELSQLPQAAMRAEHVGAGCESAPREKVSSPLVSVDSFLKATEWPAAATTNAEASSAQAPASADRRLVVEVAAIAPHQQVIHHAASPVPVSTGVAPSAVPTQPRLTTAPAITVASGPAPIALPQTAGTPPSASSQPPVAAAGLKGPSSIEDLKRLTDPAGAGFPSQAAQPATSIAPGPFTVNPEYLYRSYPTTSATTTAAPPLAGNSNWADAEEDYFYFGRPRSDALAGVAAPLSTAAHTHAPFPTLRPTTTATTATPVTVSPPVGTVLGSQRVNAALVGGGREAAEVRPRRSTSSATRPATAGARPVRALVETTNVQRRPETSRVVKDSTGKRLTPGELQILQGRERLRRQH